MGSASKLDNDLIASFERRHGVALIINRRSIRVSQLTHPSIALLEGQAPKGRIVGIQIRLALRVFLHLYSNEEQRRIRQLARICRALHAEYERDPSRAAGSMHPLAGALGRSFYYGAFVPRAGEHAGLRILRASLLRVITKGLGSPSEKRAAEVVRDVLVRQSTRRFHFDASPALFDAWHDAITVTEFAEKLRPYFADDYELAHCFAALAITPSPEVVRPAKQRGPSRIGKTRPRSSPAQKRRRTGRISPPHGAQPGGIFGVRNTNSPPGELDAPPADQISPEDVEGFQHAFALDLFQAEGEPLELVPSERLATANFEIEQTTRLHLEGALLPDTDRTLTAIEAQQVWTALEERLLDDEAQSDLSLAAAVCAGLMLLAGRRRVECISAIVDYVNGVQPSLEGALAITDKAWVTTIPSLPALGELPADWFHPVDATFELPLPIAMSDALKRLRNERVELDSSAAAQAATWEAAWSEAREALRLICPRFTETRCFHTLAVQVFAQTGHLRDAQWLTGSSLEHSTAAGHYYSVSSAEMTGRYRSALRAMGIDSIAQDTIKDTLIGAPRAATRWDKASAAVADLVSQTESAVRLSKGPLEIVLKGVHRIGAYLAVLFGVCTAHRFTASIGEVTRRDFLISTDPDAFPGLCLVADKTTTPQLDARVCALPRLFTVQLHAYIRQLERAQRMLARQRDADQRVLDLIRRALDGSGPLWFASAEFAIDQSSRVLNRHVLARMWPAWQLPLPLLRHLFASNASRFGVRGSDIAHQMGHSSGDDVFDACDPDSPLDFAHRLVDSLGDYLLALGFRSVGVARRHDPPAPLEPLSANQLTEALNHLRAGRLQRRNRQLPEPTDDEEKVGNALVQRLDADHPVESESRWLVEPSAMQALLQDQRAVSIGIQQVVRSELRKLIERRRKTPVDDRVRRRPIVPLLNAPNRQFSAISRVHLDAAYWALKLEQQALAVAARGFRDSDNEAVLAAAVLLLASYGAGTTVARLLSLLDPALRIHGFKSFQAGLIAELPLSNTESECQTISGDAVSIIGWLQENLDSAPTLRQLERAIARQAEFRSLGLSSNDVHLEQILELITLARQLSISGVRSAWERGDLATVGPALDRLGALFSVDLPVYRPEAIAVDAPAGSDPISRRDGMAEYRRLRRLTHEIAERRSVTANRKRLDELATIYRDRFGASSLVSSLAEFAIYLRHERSLADTTVYEYLTAIGSRLIRRVGAGDLLAIEPGDIEEALRAIAIESRLGIARTGVSARGVASAASHFSEMLKRVGVEIDLSRAFDGLSFHAERRPGYFASVDEIGRVEQALQRFTDTALNDLSGASPTDAAIIAEAGGRLQMASGLRLSELAGLMKIDLTSSSETLSIHVHPIKRRSLKTTASRRVTVVPLDELQETRLTELLARLSGRMSQTGDLLFAPDVAIDVPSVARYISQGFRGAASAVGLDSAYARGHVARHNIATAAILATHPDRMTAGAAALRQLDHYETTQKRLKAIDSLPRRMQFRYLSRQLGHGTPLTTISWYAHAIPLLHGQSAPWRGLPRDLEAEFLSRRASDIDRWRTRCGGVFVEGGAFLLRFNPSWVAKRAYKPTNLVTDESPVRTDPIAIDLTDLSATLAARVALAVREGVNEFKALAELGLSYAHYRAIAECLGQRDIAYGLHYMTGRRRRARSRLRIPRSHDLAKIFRALDDGFEQGRVDAETLRGWFLANLAQSRGLLRFTEETSSLAEAIGRHKRSRQLADGAGLLIRIPRSDRQLVLLVVGAISWIKKN